MADAKILLFDLGGVLVDASGQVALQRVLPYLDRPEILARWHGSRAVTLFESGKIAADEFAAAFVSEWNLPLTPAEFLESFSSWVAGFYPGAKELLIRLRRVHTVACLSNTNSTHWTRLSDADALFHVCITSHLTGYMKPDPRAFECAIRALGSTPEAIHFFDDLPANVRAAHELGMRAFQVNGLAETIAALRSCGIACDADA